MKLTIVVLFLINGVWVNLDGWGERGAETEEQCREWAENISEFLDEATDLDYKVYCK